MCSRHAHGSDSRGDEFEERFVVKISKFDPCSTVNVMNLFNLSNYGMFLVAVMAIQARKKKRNKAKARYKPEEQKRR